MKIIAIFTIILVNIHVMATASTVQDLTSQIPMPRIRYNYEHRQIKKAKAEKVVSLSFPLIHNEIEGQLYAQQSDKAHQQQLAYDKNLYRKQHVSNCKYYRSSLEISQVNNLTFQEKQQQMIKYYAEAKNQNSNLYILMDSGTIHHYKINKWDFSKQFIYQLPEQIKKYIKKFSDQMSDEQLPADEDNGTDDSSAGSMQARSYLTENIELLAINGRLFLFLESGKAYAYNDLYKNKQIQLMASYVFEGIIKAGMLSDSSVWVFNMQEIAIYEAVLQGVNVDDLYETLRVSLKQIKPEQQQDNELEIIRAMSVEQGKIFALTSDHLYIMALKDIMEAKGNQNATLRDVVTVYRFSGDYECLDMEIVDSHLLFLSCRYQRKDFLIEVCFMTTNDGKLQLNINRFYDDSTVEGIRRVENIGKDNIAFFGDDYTWIQGKGYNRNVLLEMLTRNKRQFSTSEYSYGLIDIINLQAYSEEEAATDFIVVVSQSEFKIMKIVNSPPEVECYFQQFPKKPIINILIVFNTSHCPTSQPTDHIANSMKQICQSYYPASINYAADEIEKSKAFHLFVFIVSLTWITAIICVYCGAILRKKANQSIQKIRDKIEKMKQEREHSELKKL